MLDKQVSAVILQILEKHGYDLITQPEKMEALLKDIIPGKHKETLMIILSIKEDIPNKIKSLIYHYQIDPIPLKKIETSLIENLLIQEEAAAWIIGVWREVLQQKHTKQDSISSQEINEIAHKIEEKQIKAEKQNNGQLKSIEGSFKEKTYQNITNNDLHNQDQKKNEIKQIYNRKLQEKIIITFFLIVGISSSIFGISYLFLAKPIENSVTYPAKYEKIHFSLIPSIENEMISPGYFCIDGKEKTISTPGSKYYIAEDVVVIDFKKTSNIRSIVINKVSLDKIDIANFNKPTIRYLVIKENDNISIYEEISPDNEKRFVVQIPLH